MLKNCHTCKHLEYETGDYESNIPSGWVCEKREPETEAGQIKLEKDMQSEPYRNRYKRCFESRAAIDDALRAAAVQPPLSSIDPTNIQY